MDYVPKKRAERLLWYQNLSDNLVVEAPKFGLSAAEATAAKAVADAVIAKLAATNTASAALDSARQMERLAEPAGLAQLRAKIRNWKTLPGYPASGSEGILKLKGAEAEFDPATYKPVLTASIAVDKVRIEFDKRGVDGLNFYWRLKGTPGWEKLAFDTNPPYDDTRPLANPAVPEVREYKALGVVDELEIGLPSDIVSVTFAG